MPTKVRPLPPSGPVRSGLFQAAVTSGPRRDGETGAARKRGEGGGWGEAKAYGETGDGGGSRQEEGENFPNATPRLGISMGENLWPMGYGAGAGTGKDPRGSPVAQRQRQRRAGWLVPSGSFGSGARGGSLLLPLVTWRCACRSLHHRERWVFCSFSLCWRNLPALALLSRTAIFAKAGCRKWTRQFFVRPRFFSKLILNLSFFWRGKIKPTFQCSTLSINK